MSASWRPSEAGGVIPLRTWMPENERSQQHQSQSESEGLQSDVRQEVSGSPWSRTLPPWAGNPLG